MTWDVNTPEGMKNAVAWTEAFVSRLANNAVWVVPRSGSVIELDKVNKRAVRTAGLLPETTIQKVFEAMGWTWEDIA